MRLNPPDRVKANLSPAILSVLLVVACRSPEEEVVFRYFTATLRDQSRDVAALSMVAFPETISDWTLVEVGEIETHPYSIPELRERVEQAEHERDEQFGVFGDFRRENYDDLGRIQERLRANPDAPLPPRLAELKEEWDVFRLERRAVVAKLQEAESELEQEIRRVKKSLQREANPLYLTGEVERRPVSVRVTTEDAEKGYLLTLSRYRLLNQFDALVPTRWIITAVSPA